MTNLVRYGVFRLGQIWSVVRTVKEKTVADSDEPSFEVGVAFIGKSAPPNFLSDPTKRYDLKPAPSREGLWQVRERARHEIY